MHLRSAEIVQILITGAFGYLGGRLATYLAGRGHSLILTGRTLPTWASQLSPFAACTTLDVLRVATYPSFNDVDAVIHLASLDEHEAAEDPGGALAVSGEGTRCLLDACADRVSRFIFLSTFHVYGPDAPNHLTEDTLTRPTHPHGISRLAGEGFCRAANRARGETWVTTLRPSSAYGAPVHPTVDRWHLAHNDFCRQAVTNRHLVLHAPGLQHRDFVWIEDLGQACSKVLEASTTALGDGLFQVGSGSSRSIYELAQITSVHAGHRLGRPIPITSPEPVPDAASDEVAYSITRLQNLGYIPSDQLREETIRIVEMLLT